MQIQCKFTKLCGFYRAKYISELHIQEKEWGFFFYLLDFALALSTSVLDIDKLEGIHRNVHKLSKVL